MRFAVACRADRATLARQTEKLKKSQTTILDQIHGTYVHTRRVQVLTDAFATQLPDSGTVLDVGCGDGLLASLIQQRKPGLTLTGIDVLVRKDTHVPVTGFDGRTIPFPDNSFDSVMFVDVLHHTTDPMILLREAVRVTRGTIVIKDHTLKGLGAMQTLRFMDRVSNLRYNISLPYNYLTEEQWRDAFADLGLRIVTWKRELGLYPAFANWLFGRSLHFVARLDAAK